MAPTAGVRRAIRRRAAEESVDSRWWYWIAAVLATFAFWAIAVAWVTIAVGLGPLAGPSPVVQAAEISLVAFGPPFLALVAVFPFAVYADASAVLDADVEWRPARWAFAGAAAAGPAAAIAVAAVDLLDGGFDSLEWAVLLGFLLTVPVAAYYLLGRHRRVGVP